MSGFAFHLIGASGGIRRTVRAADIHEARAKLAPVPDGWAVISDASYRAGAFFRPLGPKTCVGCGQRYKEPRSDICAKCRNARRKKDEGRGWNGRRYFTGAEQAKGRQTRIAQGIARRKAKRLSEASA